MHEIENSIRDAAFGRVGRIFKVSPSSLKLSDDFGEALSVSFISHFRANEFDLINNDIRDVADPSILKQLETGSRAVETVADYCDHMVLCHDSNPSEVLELLEIRHSGSKWPDIFEIRSTNVFVRAKIVLMRIGREGYDFGVAKRFGRCTLIRLVWSTRKDIKDAN